jgi:hypothetical protein
MAQLPATRHLKAPQPNQAKCPRVSDSAVLLFAKSGSLSQVLSSQSGARQSRFRRSEGNGDNRFCPVQQWPARCSGAMDRRG